MQDGGDIADGGGNAMRGGSPHTCVRRWFAVLAIMGVMLVVVFMIRHLGWAGAGGLFVLLFASFDVIMQRHLLISLQRVMGDGSLSDT